MVAPAVWKWLESRRGSYHPAGSVPSGIPVFGAFP